MTLELPPERRLPNPDQMVERILTEETGGTLGTEGRRVRTIAGVLAVAAAVVLAVVGIRVIGSRDPGVTATPAPPPATAAPVPTGSGAPQPIDRPTATTHLQLGQSVTFPQFTVTVVSADLASAQGLLVHARVCVRRLPPDPQGDATRISWDPWAVTTGAATYSPRLADPKRAPTDLFPPDRTWQVGRCAAGVIPFADVSAARPGSTIRYANSLGNVAVWDLP